MSIVTLNLSRKWRSQNFDQIIGQNLSVRILKNSLYLGHYFPVYLFSGQRGCGKTSTARIFAAAINCKNVPLFQKDPKKYSIPCLSCTSCTLLKEGNHPDFIEIDAASHTGVDNIRNIIESSSLLPLVGSKRVYLIDEAHMLSKAASNAALKILEEPPATALFILATTNPHKIIETVRSRCFQIFFSPIAHSALKNHLEFICQEEKIVYTDQALDLIVKHTEGSARDALNVLEQVRFSSSIINKEAVVALLHYIDDQRILDLIQHTIQGNQQALISLLHSLQIDKHKAEFLWQRMVILLRGLLWIKHSIKPHELLSSITELETFAQSYSLKDLHGIIQALYTQEELFLKTSLHHIFLEMFFIGLCQKYNNNNSNTNNSNGNANNISNVHGLKNSIAPTTESIISDSTVNVSNNNFLNEKENILNIHPLEKDFSTQWLYFVEKIATLNEPLVYSVFKKAHFVEYDQNNHQVHITLSKDFGLFKEWLDNTKKIWQPLLEQYFSPQAVLHIQFSIEQKTTELPKKSISEVVHKVPSTGVEKSKEQKSTAYNAYNAYNKQTNRYASVKRSASAFDRAEVTIDTSDEKVWKKATMLLRHFPGIITQVRETQ